MAHPDVPPPVSFATRPYDWTHWRLTLDGPVATVEMAVREDRPLRPGYELKLNSYDLGVDIELYDIVNRLRFEHPEVRAVVLTSALDRVFCAGANIRMLAASSHPFKVNFCKYTNETRCAIEESGHESGQTWIAALNGVCAGGGYELAMACDRILLIDDGSSAVSLPEVPLLGVLPGTGGLTRLVDKRRVRRDVADVFCTRAEGFKARNALRHRLVDRTIPRSRWGHEVAAEARSAAEALGPREATGIELPPLAWEGNRWKRVGRHVTLEIESEERVARLTVAAPSEPPPADHASLHAMGASAWALQAFRELEEALLELRFNHETVGLVLLHTVGDPDRVLAWDEALERLHAEGSWLAREIRLFQRRTLRRLDNTARSFFALIEPGNAFAGVLMELALAADRSYMLLDEDDANRVRLGVANGGFHTMANGLTRLQARFWGEPGRARELLELDRPLGAEEAEEVGLVTMSPDDIDWEDEVRIAIEERVSLSPDALTGMEQNLRWPGPETMETRVYGRLSAWQNWIFQRPNAVGERGALTLYGHPERPVFDHRRT